MSTEPQAPPARRPETGPPRAQLRDVALLLPGQGAQYRRMGAGLFPAEPAFARAMNEVFAMMGVRGEQLRSDWLAERPSLPTEHASWSQPLLFAIDYALGRLVLSWDLRPTALLGHSVGEIAAAALAGIFELGDAISLVLDRVDRVAAAPPGGMLAVAATADEVAPLLPADVVIGAVNAPRNTVIAGPRAELDRAARILSEHAIVTMTVPSLSAFHSPSVWPALAGTQAGVAALPRRLPTITVISGYSAAPLRPQDVRDPAFWARQPADPVLFWPALGTLLAGTALTLIEAGPGQLLSRIARLHPAVRRGTSTVVPLLPAAPADGDEPDRAALRAALGRLRELGYAVPPAPSPH